VTVLRAAADHDRSDHDRALAVYRFGLATYLRAVSAEGESQERRALGAPLAGSQSDTLDDLVARLAAIGGAEERRALSAAARPALATLATAARSTASVRRAAAQAAADRNARGLLELLDPAWGDDADQRALGVLSRTAAIYLGALTDAAGVAGVARRDTGTADLPRLLAAGGPDPAVDAALGEVAERAGLGDLRGLPLSDAAAIAAAGPALCAGEAVVATPDAGAAAAPGAVDSPPGSRAAPDASSPPPRSAAGAPSAPPAAGASSPLPSPAPGAAPTAPRPAAGAPPASPAAGASSPLPRPAPGAAPTAPRPAVGAPPASPAPGAELTGRALATCGRHLAALTITTLAANPTFLSEQGLAASVTIVTPRALATLVVARRDAAVVLSAVEADGRSEDALTLLGQRLAEALGVDVEPGLAALIAAHLGPFWCTASRLEAVLVAPTIAARLVEAGGPRWWHSEAASTLLRDLARSPYLRSPSSPGAVAGWVGAKPLADTITRDLLEAAARKTP
jgi:hypothetical protein